jgi:Xaa-Pro aminopeptidase
MLNGMARRTRILYKPLRPEERYREASLEKFSALQERMPINPWDGRLLKEGDFLVVDAGPDLDYYDIDITTSFPANGKFTPRQKEVYEASLAVYEASLAVHEANLKVYRPGLSAEKCRREVEDILKSTGFDLN